MKDNENDAPCRFAALREHKPSECPLCNPTGWMATVENDALCVHCGQPVREGEALVNWPWIHASGWYRCIGFPEGTLAEPSP